jgi:hypothetical protein
MSIERHFPVMAGGRMVISFDWQRFLMDWSRILLQDDNVTKYLSPEVIASGWLGYPGATEGQIAQAEGRLGAILPPSYRAFLKVTNGWRQTGPFITRLWSVDEIEWYCVRHQEMIDAWMEGVLSLDPNPQPVLDEEYLVYGDKQLSGVLRHEYLQMALEISDEDTADDAVYLLNPKVVTSEGEWESWFLASWRAGADRYRSFQEMMQAEYKNYLALRLT